MNYTCGLWIVSQTCAQFMCMFLIYHQSVGAEGGVLGSELFIEHFIIM